MNYKDLIEKGVDIAEVASYNHYLAESIIGDLVNGTSEDLQMGEFDFVMELWDYSLIYHQIVDDAFKREGDLPGVAVYEITDAVATRFLGGMKMGSGEMPDKERFTNEVQKIVDTWTNAKDFDASDSMEY